MGYTLKDLLNIPKLRELLDAMDEIHSMPSAIIDIEGNILTATAWQDICTKFHRINPETEKKCIESDTHISAGLDKEMPHIIYRCPMGLVDAATPIIIEGNHLGNVFTGQVFIEPTDEEYFIKQARQYGFDENKYLEAMRKVPYFPEERLHKNLAYIHSLTQLLAEQGLQHRRQYEAETSLQERKQLYQDLFSNAGEGIVIISTEGILIEVNESFTRMHGYSQTEMLQLTLKDLDTPETSRLAPERMRRLLAGETLLFEVEHYHKDGHVFPLEVTASLITSGGKSYFQSFHRDITERRHSEAALRESENRFRSIFDHSPVAIGIGDVQSSQLLEINNAWLRLLGYDRDEVIGRTIAELSLFVEFEERNEIIAIIKEQRRIVNRPVQLRHKYGPVIDILYSAELITFDMKPCLLVMMTDVTERKQENERFRSFVEHANDIVFSLSTEGIFTYVSPNWKDAFGYELEETVGKPFIPFVHPDDVAACYSALQNVFESGENQSGIEYRVLHKNGTWIWYSANGSLLRDNSKISFLGIGRDISERKRIEAELHASEQRYRLLIETASEGILVAQGANIRFVNPVISEITGYTEEELLSIPFLDFVHLNYRDLMKNNYVKRLKGEPVDQRYEIQIVKKDTSVRWVEISGARIEWEGQPATLNFVTDIADIKNAVEERQALEQQLQQSQKLESLGVLAGGIAHDFNNLLAVIIGRCSLAKLRPITAIDNIPPIEIAAERAAALCQQMLAYAGKAHTSQSLINLEDLVAEMVNLSSASIGQNVKIISALASDIPLITVDGSQIRQVTMNLIINASEAIGESYGEVRISLAKRSVRKEQHEKDHLGSIIPPGWYACLEITDNGCGMDAETQRRIFEPFYTTKFTGRGLGMSAVLGIIKSHNGALQILSEPGKGSTFKVYLPIQLAASVGDQSQQCINLPAPWKGNGTILLVEDEEQVINVAEAMLEELGFAVIKAYNGKEGLELYQLNATSITLVVTDIGMPVMDGYALFRELKQRNPTLPIVISSGFGDAEITSIISQDAIAGLMSKPYNFNVLRDVLKSVKEYD